MRHPPPHSNAYYAWRLHACSHIFGNGGISGRSLGSISPRIGIERGVFVIANGNQHYTRDGGGGGGGGDLPPVSGNDCEMKIS